MMAGDVAVAVTNGILTVRGDDQGNDVQIRQLKQTYTGEWPGVKLEIVGEDANGNATTTINGQPKVIVTGVKNGVAIDLGERFENYLRVANIGGGADMIKGPTAAVALPGQVTITSGGGRDIMKLYINNGFQVGVDAGGVNTGDDVVISGSKLNKLQIGLGAARGKYALVASQVESGTQVQLAGSGEFRVSSAHTQLKGGLTVETASANILLGDASQPTQLLKISGDVNIQQRFGFVTMTQVDLAGSLTVSQTDGDNQVNLQDVTATGDISVACGEGIDSVSIKTTKASRTTLDGGLRQDTLTLDSASDLGELVIRGFETINQT